jgi:hypothetical protein
MPKLSEVLKTRSVGWSAPSKVPTLPPRKEENDEKQWFRDTILAAIPKKLPPIIDWARAEFKLYGVDGVQFDPEKTPWTNYVLILCDDMSIRTITYVKPVQSGGSTVGEIVLARRILTSFGEIQYNWPNDQRAKDRWDKYTERRLKECSPVRKLWPEGGSDRFKAQKCLVVFPNVNFTQQGVYTPSNLDSDSVSVMVNEELHSWEQGMMQKAKGRQTRVAFPFCLNISNAGVEGDQLHEAFKSGTMQELEVKCPGCGLYHVMRTRWEESRPDLGGLRYDSEAAKVKNGAYDYNRLIPTIRYQMPCGFIVRNDITERRKLSSSCRYSEPKNEGALLSNRSLTHEAVVCHNISWVDLIQEKHAALRALDSGNDEPWKRYLQERECRFYSAQSKPFRGQVVLNKTLKKTREGMTDRAARFWFADKQKGRAKLGEMVHYWLVIRDVLANGNSQLVYEGLVQTDSDLIARLDEHKCIRNTGAIDCTWDRVNVLQFCYRNGLNAQTTSPQNELFHHKADKVRRIYSEAEALHKQLNVSPIYNYVASWTEEKGKRIVEYVPAPAEPRHWNINKYGALRLYFFLRDHQTRMQQLHGADCSADKIIYYEVPGDVSEDYKSQSESWEIQTRAMGPSKQIVEQLVQIKPQDHLLICEAGICVLLEMSGILGQRLALLGLKSPAELIEKTDG